MYLQNHLSILKTNFNTSAESIATTLSIRLSSNTHLRQLYQSFFSKGTRLNKCGSGSAAFPKSFFSTRCPSTFVRRVDIQFLLEWVSYKEIKESYLGHSCIKHYDKAQNFANNLHYTIWTTNYFIVDQISRFR